MKCKNCSAPMQNDSTKCEYCGCLIDVDLQSVHTYTVEEPIEDRICPHCNIAMQTLNLEQEGAFFIERCEKCMGLFFDPNELETLLEMSVAHVHSINYSQLDQITRKKRFRGSQKKIRWLKCPVCRQFMNRKSFGTRSGVVVDRCRNHGIWLEGAEFRCLLEWKKAGGSILHERREKIVSEQKQRQQDRKERIKKRNHSASNEGFITFGHHHRHHRDHTDIASSLIRGLLNW